VAAGPGVATKPACGIGVAMVMGIPLTILGREFHAKMIHSVSL
jgi:hypothetical protein